MKTELITCNFCERSNAASQTVGWIRLKNIEVCTGLRGSGFQQFYSLPKSGTIDLCSPECAAKMIYRAMDQAKTEVKS